MKIYRWFLQNKVWFTVAVFSVSTGVLLWAMSSSSQHDFNGVCQMCHVEIPQEGTPFEEVVLTDTVERLCARCHDMTKGTSHPIGVKPRRSIPLQRYLDSDGRLTCTTCHDVHKEKKYSFRSDEVKGLLRGHAQGRYFCFTCHSEEHLGAVGWSHNVVITYAHLPGEMAQEEYGGLVDEYSVECLSCHDGILSTMGSVQVKTGTYSHSIGLSHPVGVLYPRGDREFVPAGALPQEIPLFAGKVGCLSCHNPYGNEKGLLVMENRRSALCLSCHEK